MPDSVWSAALALAVVLASAFVVGCVLLIVSVRRLRRLSLPDSADFWTTLRAVPLPVVVAIDLLDLSLDTFAAPVVWFLLRNTRLTALRNVAAVEAFIPFTGPVPVLTISWLAARLMPRSGLMKPADPVDRPAGLVFGDAHPPWDAGRDSPTAIVKARPISAKTKQPG